MPGLYPALPLIPQVPTEATQAEPPSEGVPSEEALFASQSRSVEVALWSAVRALEEKAELSRRLAEQAGRRGLRRAVTQFEGTAREAEHGSNIIRRTLLKSPVREPLDAEAEPQDAEPQDTDVAALARGTDSR